MKNVRNFALSVDPVIFSLKDDKLFVLLIKRSGDTFSGEWALPGGLIKENETLEESLSDVLKEKTGVKINYSEQLYTRTGHDPRGPTVSVAYIALVNHQEVSNSAKWIEVEKAKEFSLAFDHNEVLNKALERLTNKVNYSTLPMYFLEEKFTLPKLQKVYEVLLSENLDKSTFRKKIMETGFIEEIGEYVKSGAHRPSKVYSIKSSNKVHNFKRNII